MIIRLADCPPQPWKNGLGRTREIAVHPSTADRGHFVWRVSVAEVDSGAPFSTFPGIDRHIVLLDGAGFTMTLDHDRTHALTMPFTPFAFAGEAQVDVTLADGPTCDFNLMVRRAQARGEVQVWHEPRIRTPHPSTALIFCARGVIDTVGGCLNVGDAWRPPAHTIGPIALRDGALALVVRIEPHAA